MCSKQGRPVGLRVKHDCMVKINVNHRRQIFGVGGATTPRFWAGRVVGVAGGREILYVIMHVGKGCVFRTK